MAYNSDQLLCTFSSTKTYESEIKKLVEIYNIYCGRIYVLSNVENSEEIFLTFNGTRIGEFYHPKTISIHRKKDYNVLYSINALNELVKLENLGGFSSNVNINWEKYRSSIITTKDGKLKITPTKLVKIFQL